uniref:Uncharacterized protein n=1 Tax=Anopheles culicifacies TaxID=139723 RepID=A0A182MEQ3_9DIPT
MSTECTATPVTGSDPRYRPSAVQPIRKPDVSFPELPADCTLLVLVHTRLNPQCIEPDDIAAPPSARIPRRLVPMVRMEGKAGRVVCVRAVLLRSQHEVGLRFAQRFEQQPADQ